MSARRSVRRHARLFAPVLFFAAAIPASAQTSATRAYVETLASEKFAGREAGSGDRR